MVLKLLLDRARLNLYPWYFAEECLTKDIKKAFGKNTTKEILEFKKSHIQSYADLEEFNEFGEFLFNKLKEDKGFYKVVEKNILQTGKELLDFCNNLPKDLKKPSDEQLVEIYMDYRDKTIKMRAWGWLPPLVDGAVIYFLSDYLQEKLRAFLKESSQEEKTAEYYSILSSSDKTSEVQVEELERLELTKELQSDKDSVKNVRSLPPKEAAKKLNPKALDSIKAHAKKFGWLTYAYLGPPMSEENVIELIKDSLDQKQSLDEQVENIHLHYKNLRKEKEEIIRKIKLPEELKYLFDISAFFMHLKDLRKGIYQKSYVLMDPVIEEIAKRLKLTIEQTKYLTGDEIKQALIEKKDFSKSAKERTEYCVAVIEKGKTKVFTGSKAKEIIKKETEEKVIEKDVKELKGSTAYSGKVKGIVKIILVRDDIPKIKEGEILVSSATNPDLIVAMKKAAAFITDMGGITSHAAIVSREMKKPCVVGTKIATKVLKDGMEVEVDANKGIVRILGK